jgi:hypothetical protein
MEIIYLSVIFILSLTIVVMALGNRKKKIQLPPVKLHLPKDVQTGEKIWITFIGHNTPVVCLNNNTVHKKIAVRVTFTNKSTSDYVFNYSGSELRDFSTLNPVPKEKVINVDTALGVKFEAELKVAVEQDRFEEAGILKDAIDKLKELKKQKA